MPDVEITRDTWPKLIDVVQKKSGSEQPVWKCVAIYYSVCLVSIVTSESRAVWNMYQDIGGLQNETFASYLQLPAPWIATCQVISSETRRIDQVRASTEERKAARAQRERKKRAASKSRAKR